MYFFLFLINLRNMETQFGTSISEFRIFNMNHLKLSFTRSTQKQQQLKRYITVVAVRNIYKILYCFRFVHKFALK